MASVVLNGGTDIETTSKVLRKIYLYIYIQLYDIDMIFKKGGGGLQISICTLNYYSYLENFSIAFESIYQHNKW